MVVAVVSLVVALLCVLYVMERPGTIAIGSPLPTNGIRVIECGEVGESATGSGEPPTVYVNASNKVCGVQVWGDINRVAWKKITVPEGKKWIVIVSPGGSGGLPSGEVTGFFTWSSDYGGMPQSGILHSGDHKVFLYVVNGGGRGSYWATVPVVYLVLEVDE